MGRIFTISMSAAVLLFLLTGAARAAEFCASTVGELWDAFSTAKANGEDDIIKVVQGTYGGIFRYDTSDEGNSIALLGGYMPGCGSRLIDPTNTILDGGASNNRVLLFFNYPDGGDITVDGLTLQNGEVSGGGGGILAYTYSDSGTSGKITITNSIIKNNSSSEFGGGVHAYSVSISGTAGSVILTNNIITGNLAEEMGGGGVYAASVSGSGPGGTVTLTNNTITGNNAPVPTGGGGGLFSFMDNNTVNVYNNIIWGNTSNTGGDIYLGGTGTANGFNNVYLDISGSWNNYGGNDNFNPLFVGAGNYHLRSTSLCIDAGINAAPNLPANDFEGDDRIFDGDKNGTATVDIGADEYSPGSINSHNLLLLLNED